MNSRKLLIISFGLLLICQLGWAQSATQTAAQVKAIGALAAQSGKPVPLVPAASTPSGFFRPTIWVAGQLSPPKGLGLSPNALPSFCNKFRTNPTGFQWCPNAMQVAYGVPFKNTPAGKTFDGTGITIAIVDAFHYANAEADLANFNATMGLPACTKANGCFKNVDQNGGQNFCSPNAGWELETMLDLQWAHTMAPGAKLILVEGCTNSYSDLFTAVTTAVGMADIVSNSYGSGEFGGETGYDPVLNVNKPILFSSGDGGAPPEYPCVSPYVTCVGGTSLLPVSTVNFARASETGWSGSGGGCSLFDLKPVYQSGYGITVCSSERAAPDIAAVADPNTGAIVYDSGNGGWWLVGGTSLATPLSAGIFAVDMQARGGKFLHQINGDLYVRGCHGTGDCVAPGQINPYFFFDVLVGNNGFPAVPGYDLVTGMGVAFGKSMGGLYGIPTP